MIDMRWICFSIGILFLTISLMMPISLIGCKYREYDLDDYEINYLGNDEGYGEYDYYGYFNSGISLRNLSDGKLIIRFGQKGLYMEILYISLSKMDGEHVWGYEGGASIGGGDFGDHKIVDITEGDYYLYMEWDAHGSLDLNVKYISKYTFFSIPSACCLGPSMFVLSFVPIIFSFKKKEISKVSKGDV